MTEETDVVMVGAGGGGAVLALALAKQGIRTVVLDQATGPPKGLRGEILQPNGQRVLDRLGVLQSLPADATRSVRLFHFCRAGGMRLCSIDYGDLPPPYNRAIVTLPNVARHAIVAAVQQDTSVTLRYGTSFTGLIREGNQVVGVSTQGPDGTHTVRAKIVVGADGAFSKVREALKIPADLYLYLDGYLIAILESDEPVSESFYYVGHRTILGIFPATGNKAYLFYMIPKDSMEAVKQQGIPALQQIWSQIAPQFSRLFRCLNDWGQYADWADTHTNLGGGWSGADRRCRPRDESPCLAGTHAGYGRCHGAGRSFPSCLNDRNYSAERLKEFERARRPQVTTLQQLADQLVFYWNTKNPVVAFLRDRVFQTLDRNARLRYQVLSTTAGLRTMPPFNLIDRVIAAGLLPDIRAHERSPHPMSL